MFKNKKLNSFHQSLNKFDEKINKIESNLKNASDLINEECSELQRKVQLNTEEIIAALKTSNGYEINDEETSLRSDLQAKITQIYKESSDLLTRIEEYEHEMNKAFNLNETKQKYLMDELADMKEIIQKWRACLHNKANPMIVANIKKAKKELFHFNSKSFNNKADMLIFNESYFEFIENSENKLGSLVLYESVGFEKLLTLETMLNHYQQLVRAELNENTHFEIDYEIIGNGLFIFNNYFVLQDFSVVQELAIYDSNESKILKKFIINIDLEILTIKTCSNKIAVECDTNNSDISDESMNGSVVLILDFDFNVICRKEVNASDLLSADDKYLYFNDQNLVLYDWSLNEIQSGIKLQNEHLEKPFYMDEITDCMWNILQAQYRDGVFVFSIKTTSQVNSFIFIFDETGVQLNKLEVKQPSVSPLYKEFRIDSKNNIITFESSENYLKYHTLRGDLFKEISLKKKSKDVKKYNFTNFLIDLDDKLYFI